MANPEEHDSEHGSSSEEEEGIERELADVSFEELQRALSDGRHSIPSKSDAGKKFGRANKNRPMEISCKKPVGRFRQVVQGPKKVVRDPRFESLCGTLDENGFRKRYNFLFEVELPQEREKLQKVLKKTKDPSAAGEIKKHISWIDRQLKVVSTKRSHVEKLTEHKKKEREAAKQGKRPFYLKKSELRKQMLVEKYDDLKVAGKLEAFMAKKRRRNASKDHRYVPYRRDGGES
ncbi:hypothetical protein AMTRI_Chr09g42880 [Amborella trichopoda]